MQTCYYCFNDSMLEEACAEIDPEVRQAIIDFLKSPEAAQHKLRIETAEEAVTLQ